MGRREGGLAQHAASRLGGVRDARTHSGESLLTTSFSQKARRSEAEGDTSKGAPAKDIRKASPSKNSGKMHADTTLI